MPPHHQLGQSISTKDENWVVNLNYSENVQIQETKENFAPKFYVVKRIRQHRNSIMKSVQGVGAEDAIPAALHLRAKQGFC